ncbi:proteasome assembly chaperone 3 [Vigna unguiculata]|uniref:Proteasome assembly chaperone 3 n=1 Tax=Vigna unguiculata TaxID=3917 RepID=A0A4D6NSV2_VIGUN|nr:proteasome assembly chaperone 3 [Vigna unguiculata]
MSPNIENVIGTHIHSAVHKIFRSLCPQVHVLNVLMQPMLVACARQLIEQMSLSGSSRPLVLSLGLKDHSVRLRMKVVWFYILMPICADRRANIILLIPP